MRPGDGSAYAVEEAGRMTPAGRVAYPFEEAVVR